MRILLGKQPSWPLSTARSRPTLPGQSGDAELALFELAAGLALHVDLPITTLSFVNLPTTGQLTAVLAVPHLSGYRVYVGQTVFIAQNGALFETEPRTVLVTP